MQTLFRRLRPVLAVTIFLAPLTLIGPAAFAQAAADADKNPATNADILLYRAIGSSYVCNARTAGVDFPKAVGIAAATYAQIINGRHGGFVASAGTEKLTTKQLFSGAEFQVITGAIQYCPKEVPTDVKTKVEEALKKQQKAK